MTPYYKYMGNQFNELSVHLRTDNSSIDKVGLTSEDEQRIIQLYQLGEFVTKAVACEKAPLIFETVNQRARDICGSCPMRLECIAQDFSNIELNKGTAGGLSETERDRLRRKLKIEALYNADGKPIKNDSETHPKTNT